MLLIISSELIRRVEILKEDFWEMEMKMKARKKLKILKRTMLCELPTSGISKKLAIYPPRMAPAVLAA